MGRLLLKFLLITVPCFAKDAENTGCLFCPAYISVGQSEHKHTHMHSHPFHNESKGKVEKRKALGFKAEESISEFTLTLIREDLGGYGLQYISESSQAFVAKGE